MYKNKEMQENDNESSGKKKMQEFYSREAVKL